MLIACILLYVECCSIIGANVCRTQNTIEREQQNYRPPRDLAQHSNKLAGEWLVYCQEWLVRHVYCQLWLVYCQLWLVYCQLWLVYCQLWLVYCQLWLVYCQLWLIRRVYCRLWLVRFIYLIANQMSISICYLITEITSNNTRSNIYSQSRFRFGSWFN